LISEELKLIRKKEGEVELRSQGGETVPAGATNRGKGGSWREGVRGRRIKRRVRIKGEEGGKLV